MMWLKWFPWRYVVRHAARSHGFIDPIALLASLHRFAQPSEVGEPIELLRAGVVLHARGLINSRIIQHNLDWLWPYWVERQFDPGDDAFIPRAFSITHINLSHRNWTAVGVPDFSELPLVDPRGLVTPFWDGWSLDYWIVTDDHRRLLPSRLKCVTQRLDYAQGLAVQTEMAQQDLLLHSRVQVQMQSGIPQCLLDIRAEAGGGGWLVLSLRPYNPEGISFVHDLALARDRKGWTVNGEQQVLFSDPVERHHISRYRRGDVLLHLDDPKEEEKGECRVGMLTGAALFRIQPGKPRMLSVNIPLDHHRTNHPVHVVSWERSLEGHCALRIPDQRLQYLYDVALRTVILHSPDEVYPGPFTYKRFWFRDAAFIIYGLLCSGLIDRAERALHLFSKRQTRAGYFLSQEGEWDSNGEALWIFCRFCEMTGRPPHSDWLDSIRRGARWIVRKRTDEEKESLHAGLLPAGFSAEHLGPNDYYYWDDFWGVAGLQAASRLMHRAGDSKASAIFAEEADFFLGAIERSLRQVALRLHQEVLPASPYRRLDAGAIGSLVIGYPLQLCGPQDPRLLNTVEFLVGNCMVQGGFFQDMIHSGINAYLTLHMAQVLLRAGDPRYLELMQTVAGLASPTGQWPEAIHPRTLGGCMGDGQHSWAAAEWILMIRNCFVREEGDGLILGAGVAPQWLEGQESLSFGPAPTSFGTIVVSMERVQEGPGKKVLVSWQGEWHGEVPPIELRLPGFVARSVSAGEQSIEMEREPSA
ncbi:MAG: hypothetical protein KJ990_04075 [Proteobacteria bacterium]|nr:hypothetical protein [Pseudomonadota bacterium]MBU1650335.1 hypothetical protein [Pseudomonadota bacterium]MBU1987016.1 hypothetical protein [Pseudomonadota bacterium]